MIPAMNMDVEIMNLHEVHSSNELTARQWGQRSRRLQERERGLQQVVDRISEGPKALDSASQSLLAMIWVHGISSARNVDHSTGKVRC